jgi:hypothetical protein
MKPQNKKSQLLKDDWFFWFLNGIVAGVIYKRNSFALVLTITGSSLLFL